MGAPLGASPVSLPTSLPRWSSFDSLSVKTGAFTRHPLAPHPRRGVPPIGPRPSSRRARSWRNVRHRVVEPHVRSVVVWTVALLVALSQFVSLVPVPGGAAGRSAIASARPLTHPATGPNGSLSSSPLERLAVAAFVDAEPRPLPPVRWTELHETASGPSQAKTVFSASAWASPLPASSFTDIGTWTIPQWAEPEADVRAHLALLRYLPAQPPASGRISSLFGPRHVPHASAGGQLRFHAGVDIAIPTGTPVVAPGPGIVVGVGYGRQFGRYVRILHEHVGLETLLAHLSSVEPGLRRGTRVKRGQVLGRSGNSGLSTGPHLHYEFRTVWEQRPVDPRQVYALYRQALDRVADFPVASTHAHLPPYRIEGALWNENSDRGPSPLVRKTP